VNVREPRNTLISRETLYAFQCVKAAWFSDEEHVTSIRQVRPYGQDNMSSMRPKNPLALLKGKLTGLMSAVIL